MSTAPRNSPYTPFSLTWPDGTTKTAAELGREADERVAAARARAAALRDALADTAITVTSRDQAATVTVGAAGAVQGIRLSDRVRSMGPAMVSASIMEAYQEATQQAAHHSAEVSRELTGSAEAH